MPAPQREAPGVEILCGVHPVVEALEARRRKLRTLYVRAGRRRPEVEGIPERARAAGLPVRELDADRFDTLTRGVPSQGLALEAGALPELTLDALTQRPGAPRWLVALDGVEDPQNLGAIARVADASGVLGLVLTERRAPPLSPAVSRASAGAIEWLPVARVKNLSRALGRLKEEGFWTFGADPQGEFSLFEASDRQLRGDRVLVLGAEGRGIRPGVRASLDHTLRIPLAGHVASLNVSAAAAVVLFDWVRRTRGEAGG